MELSSAIRGVVAVLAVTALASCGGGGNDPSSPDAVAELTSVDQLASAFAADAGKPRLVLLFSPT